MQLHYDTGVGTVEKPPLMSDQISRELRYYLPWITDRAPPAEGFYLVSIEHGEGFKSVRLERWDNGWPELGGYATVNGWWWVPEAI